MPNSLSSISAKTDTCLPEKRRAYRNFEGTVFAQVTKKLFRLFLADFSPVPRTVIVSNMDFSVNGLLNSNEELYWQLLEAYEDSQALNVVCGEFVHSPKGEAMAIPNKKGQR